MHRSAVPSRYHPPPGLTGRGRFCAPPFHRRAGATRAYKWRGISGRTRAPCGWLIARTRARHLPRHAPLPRARAAPAADGDRSDDDIGVDHPIDVSTGHACDRPQSPPPLGRRFDRSQRARCMQTAAG